MRSLDTYYNGYMFRSRLEARWAVFFDACGVKWEYEAQGYDLGDGLWYLPDFVLHDVTFNHAGYSTGNDLFVEVKGAMDQDDANKIKLFGAEKPLLVVGEIPNGENLIDLCYDMEDRPSVYDVTQFNFDFVDHDYFPAHPGVDLDGTFNLFGGDCSYLDACDERATVNAYRKARCARFGQGDVIVEKLKKGVI